MTALDVAHRYFDAWNRHDPAAIMAMFADGATYEDPLTGGPVSGDAIGAVAGGLFAAFPEVQFSILSEQLANGMVSVQWLMEGTNLGSMNGLPPTGKRVSLPGADFIAVDGDRIRSVRGYFDGGALPRQLGLQVIVQPSEIGPFTFGASAHVGTGNRRPGAFSTTLIHCRTEAEMAEVGERSKQVLIELSQAPGFIAAMTAAQGLRGFTTVAYERPEDIRVLQEIPSHQEAMARFLKDDFAAGGTTMTWSLARLSNMVRCTTCHLMAHLVEENQKCACGARLPPALPYW